MFHQQWQAYGYRVRFEWNDAVFLPAITDIVLPDWEKVGGDRFDALFELLFDERNIIIKQNGQVKSQNITLDSVSHTLKRLCHLDVATYAKDLVFVHAGVVLTEFGLLLLPGRSFAGKSTLVKSLVDAGCRYYSDEYALVDEQGLVRPFPRRLCLRLSKEENAFLPARSLGWDEMLRPEPVAAVLVTRYEKGATWEPQALSQGTGVLKLLENTVCARTDPQKAIRFLTTAIGPSVCFESARGESGEAAEQILKMMKAQRS